MVRLIGGDDAVGWVRGGRTARRTSGKVPLEKTLQYDQYAAEVCVDDVAGLT